MKKTKLIRVTTVPISLKILLKGQLAFFSDYFKVIGISSSGKELEDVALDEGISVIPVEMTRTISPLKDMKAVWQLYLTFRREKPLIVHTHTPKAGIAGMIAARLAGVEIRMHTVAGLPLIETKGLKRNILNLVEKLTYYCATNIYPNSRGLYDFILNHKFCKKQKLKIIANGSSNGIDISHFDPALTSISKKETLRKSLQINLSDFIFIFVGRLVGDKGINELVKAFTNVSEKYPHVKLLLVGPRESDLDPLLSETLEEIYRNQNIIAVGYQEDVRSYYSISNCLLFPSYREGFPNVVLQAGSMGLPAIVSDINGCNEIIIDGKNGIIIPPKKTKHLIEAMIDFVENEELIHDLSLNSRKMIVDRYQQDIVWDCLLKEYQRLVRNV